VNCRRKDLIDSKHLSPRLQEIDPCDVQEIIDEDHITTMSPFRNEGRMAPYIRVNEIKWSSGRYLTSKIHELYLFAKLTTHTRK
jgi:hypothetical protein